MVETELIFPGDFINGMVLMILACVSLPIFYFLFYAFKRKINYIAILAAFAGYIVFGLFINSLLQGFFAPESAIDQIGPVMHSVIRSIVVGITSGAGIYICLRMLAIRYDSLKTPISFGLGFSLYALVFEGGFNTLIKFSMASAVNEKGLQEVLETVDITQRASLQNELEALATIPLSDILFTTGKYICFFVFCITLTRLIWYSIRGERHAPSWLYLPAAIFLRILLELPIALYINGVYENLVVSNIIHYALTLISILLSIYASRYYDNKEKVVAGPLNRSLL